MKTTIEHGVTLEGGIGFEPVQTPGPHTVWMTITGKSDTSLTLNVKLTYVVYLMDFQLLAGDSLINLASPQYMQGIYNAWGIPGDSTWSIVNSGNVPITITVTAFVTSRPLLAQYTLAAGQTYILLKDTVDNAEIVSCYANGVVANPRKLLQGADGSVAMALDIQ